MKGQSTYLFWSILILYFLGMLFIGFLFRKKQKTLNDFFRGGQTIPWWAAGLSIFGTALSAITYIAVPAKVYHTDWSYIANSLTILLVAPIVAGFFLPFFRQLNVTTAYQYLEYRFDAGIRIMASILFLLFQWGRIAVILYLPALVLSTVTGINIHLSILMMGGVSLVYTMTGGLKAVIWTDVFQSFILTGGVLFCIIIFLRRIPGGISEIIQVGNEFDKWHFFDPGFDYTQPVFFVILIGGLFTNLITYGTDQTIIQRYYST